MGGGGRGGTLTPLKIICRSRTSAIQTHAAQGSAVHWWRGLVLSRVATCSLSPSLLNSHLLVSLLPVFLNFGTCSASHLAMALVNSIMQVGHPLPGPGFNSSNQTTFSSISRRSPSLRTPPFHQSAPPLQPSTSSSRSRTFASHSLFTLALPLSLSWPSALLIPPASLLPSGPWLCLLNGSAPTSE